MVVPQTPRIYPRNPLFTVVTTVLNGANTLEATLQSVAGQTFRDFEYIVLDGASVDDSVAIIEKHSQSIDYWSSEPDRGIYNAWNKALCLARGEWISFIGADDVYHPDALGEYAKAAASTKHEQVQYISSRVRLLQGKRVVRTIGSAWTWPAFARYMTVAHVGSVHHRSLFNDVGHFDETFQMSGDYELLLRLGSNLRTSYIDRVTADMNLGGKSNSSVAAALREQERAKRDTAGRAPLLCALERRLALAKSALRSLVWY